MKVILISKVSNKGNIGDVVEVKDGYARNFLIPKNKAIHYSAANYKIFEDKKKEFEANNKESIKKADEVKKIINGKDIIVIENASDDGRLYGAVNTTVIAAKVNEIDKSLKISRSDIVLEKIIKDTGVYNVTVNLYSDVNAELRLIVSRNESEIDAVIKKAAALVSQEKDEKEEASKVKKSETADNKEEVVTQEESSEATAETEEEAKA